ncbi:MAG: hypothetical protein KJ559_03430 [Nanoarchaeota archaeon]|nr:hypothetical protein [Nanoarchaeota archaeon]
MKTGKKFIASVIFLFLLVSFFILGMTFVSAYQCSTCGRCKSGGGTESGSCQINSAWDNCGDACHAACVDGYVGWQYTEPCGGSGVCAGTKTMNCVAVSWGGSGWQDGVCVYPGAEKSCDNGQGVCDSSGDCKDTTFPTIQFIEESTTSQGAHSQNYISVNVSASDNNQVDSVIINLYDSNKILIDSVSQEAVVFSALNDGTYYINATVIDDAGNENSTETREIVLDTVVPYVGFVSPLNQTYVTSEIILNITSSDDSSSVLWNNGTEDLIYTESLSLILEDGVYTFYAYSNDTSNNIAQSEVSFSIDTTAPVITDISTNPELPLTNKGKEQDITINFSSDEYPISVFISLYDSADNLIDVSEIYVLNNLNDLPVSYKIKEGLDKKDYFIEIYAEDLNGNYQSYDVGSFSVKYSSKKKDDDKKDINKFCGNGFCEIENDENEFNCFIDCGQLIKISGKVIESEDAENLVIGFKGNVLNYDSDNFYVFLVLSIIGIVLVFILIVLFFRRN